MYKWNGLKICQDDFRKHSNANEGITCEQDFFLKVCQNDSLSLAFVSVMKFMYYRNFARGKAF